jgi:hypothetical protein
MTRKAELAAALGEAERQIRSHRAEAERHLDRAMADLSARPDRPLMARYYGHLAAVADQMVEAWELRRHQLAAELSAYTPEEEAADAALLDRARARALANREGKTKR